MVRDQSMRPAARSRASCTWLANLASQRPLDEIRTLRANQDGAVPLHEQRAVLLSARRELAAYMSAPRVEAVLNELALHLPSTTWLQSVRFESGTLKMAGFSTEPTAAAAALERSAVLSRVTLDKVAAPADGTPASTGAMVQFELSASVQPEKPR